MNEKTTEQTAAAGHPTIAQLLQQGLFHHRQGDIPTAMERYAEVLRLDAENTEALYYVAVVACQEGQFKEGADLARRALSLGPGTAKLHNLLGQALDRLGQPLEAVKNFDKAIELDPTLAAAHGNRANILVDAGMATEALKSFNRAIELNPASTPDLINRGALLEELGRPEEALKDYDTAIATDPTYPEVDANRGSVLKDLGLIEIGRGEADSPRFTEAMAAYDRAIKANKALHSAYLGRGILKLTLGDWPGGFADYEHRAEAGKPGFTPLPEPRWDGAPLQAGDKLVLVTEQGLGDTIQFCRFAAQLAAQGVEVTVLARPAMVPLLSTLKNVKVIGDAEALAAPYRWAPLMSVPGFIGTTPETLPPDVPYLAADPARVAAWADKLGDAPFKIGINWAPGHADKTMTSRRDMPLAAFAKLAALPGVELIALQKGAPAGEVATAGFKVRTVEADMRADGDYFLDTAAIMESLDLVIGCDAAVVHLAGALARPVFTAVPVISDWRWMIRRDTSPWYPTMTLFRQDATRHWGAVMARIEVAVRAKLA
ncbi:MAG: tetratricopeptide repeat protein [Rhodopseudomonas sp.]|nr:tetratricopeptide repeat protein [Rhodopseudomonas sp.]